MTGYNAVSVIGREFSTERKTVASSTRCLCRKRGGFWHPMSHALTPSTFLSRSNELWIQHRIGEKWFGRRLKLTLEGGGRCQATFFFFCHGSKINPADGSTKLRHEVQTHILGMRDSTLRPTQTISLHAAAFEGSHCDDEQWINEPVKF